MKLPQLSLTITTATYSGPCANQHHPNQPSQTKPMTAPTFEVQTYRGISLGWVAAGQRYYDRAYAERLLAIRRRVDPWSYVYRVAKIG